MLSRQGRHLPLGSGLDRAERLWNVKCALQHLHAVPRLQGEPGAGASAHRAAALSVTRPHPAASNLLAAGRDMQLTARG